MLPRFKNGEMTEFVPSSRCDLVFSTAIMIAGLALSAYSAVRQGQAQKQTMDYQAAVARQRATREQQEASAREADFRRQQSRAEAKRRALGGVSGVETGEGSPLLAAEDFSKEVELTALRIRAGGEVKATRLEQAANLAQFQGGQAATAGFVRGGALLAQGAGKAFKGTSSDFKIGSA